MTGDVRSVAVFDITVHTCGDTCGVPTNPCKLAAFWKPSLTRAAKSGSLRISPHAAMLGRSPVSRPTMEKGACRRRGAPNRADCGEPVERGVQSAQGRSQRDDLSHVVRPRRRRPPE